MEIMAGKTYFGPDNARRSVIAVDGDTVRYWVAITCREDSCDRATFEAWCEGSTRRTYLGDDGERRTKLGTREDGDGAAMVAYVAADAPYEPVLVPADEWAAWRAEAQ